MRLSRVVIALTMLLLGAVSLRGRRSVGLEFLLYSLAQRFQPALCAGYLLNCLVVFLDAVMSGIAASSFVFWDLLFLLMSIFGTHAFD